MSRILLLIAVLFTFAGLPLSPGPAGAQETAAREPMILPVNPHPLVIGTQSGDRAYSIEVAANDRERAAGLMYRTEMADRHGMLFVFETTREVGFWMRNTPMALDLVFIGEDGVIRDILPGEPYSTATISPGVPVRFVLEVKQGRAQADGMAAGDRVRHPAIDDVAGRD